MKTTNLLIAAALFTAVITACEKEDIAANTQSSQPTGSAGTPSNAKAIQVNSSPGEEAQEYRDCFIEIDKIEAFTAAQGWIMISDQDQPVNLTQAQLAASATIASVADSTFQRMEKIRITLGNDNFLTAQNGDRIALHTASSSSFVIDVDRDGINQKSAVILHFDLNQALREDAGGFIFDPVINFLEDPDTGVSGQVEGAAQALISLDNDHFSFQTFLTADGRFMIRDVEEGSYRLLIKPIFSGINDLQARIINVVVVDGQITSTGQISFN